MYCYKIDNITDWPIMGNMWNCQIGFSIIISREQRPYDGCQLKAQLARRENWIWGKSLSERKIIVIKNCFVNLCFLKERKYVCDVHAIKKRHLVADKIGQINMWKKKRLFFEGCWNYKKNLKNRETQITFINKKKKKRMWRFLIAIQSQIINK